MLTISTPLHTQNLLPILLRKGRELCLIELIKGRVGHYALMALYPSSSTLVTRCTRWYLLRWLGRYLWRSYLRSPWLRRSVSCCGINTGRRLSSGGREDKSVAVFWVGEFGGLPKFCSIYGIRVVAGSG